MLWVTQDNSGLSMYLGEGMETENKSVLFILMLSSFLMGKWKGLRFFRFFLLEKLSRLERPTLGVVHLENLQWLASSEGGYALN